MFIETTTTLEALLKENGRLDWERAMRILAELVEALNALHQQGQALGNLHPGQIFFDEAGKVYIGALNGLDNWQPNDDQRALIHYQAPEQLQGAAPTPLSDQFSLAVIFQEMISGQLPFDSEDEAWLRHLILVEPSALLPSDVELPLGAGYVLRRALAKTPEQRFEDALAFSWALEALTASPERNESRSKSQRLLRRHIAMVLGVGGALASVVAFFIIAQKGLTFWETPTPSPSPPPTRAALAPMKTVTPTATNTPTPEASPTIITESTAEGGGVLAAIEPTMTPTATHTSQPTPTPIPTPSPTPIPMAEAVRQANLRRGPATTHPLAAVAQKGQRFPITGRTADGRWLRVRVEGIDMWIAASLAKVQGDIQAIKIVTHPPTPPPPPIAKIRPIPLAPEPGRITSGEELVFSWNWPGPALPEGYAFALLMWSEGQPNHPIATVTNAATQVNYNPYLSPAARQGGPGRYYWAVVVIKTPFNQIIGAESEPRLLILEPQIAPAPPTNGDNDNHRGDGGGGNDGDNNGDTGGNDGDDDGGNGGNPPPPSQRTPTPRPDDPS